MNRVPPFVVAIGGLDPSCGAGIVADARSIEAMGAMPLVVATSLTVQSGSGVRGFSPVAAGQVLAQLDELLANLPIATVKIGQVPTAEVAEALAKRLAEAGPPVVLDPVLRASGGGDLADEEACRAILRLLLPLARLVTVNLDEASVFTGRRVKDLDGMEQAAEELAGHGAGAVLVKGGHLEGDPTDLLRDGREVTVLRANRIEGSVHGSGCALASAVAARLACGDDLATAVATARDHVRELIAHAVVVGAARLRPRTTRAASGS